MLMSNCNEHRKDKGITYEGGCVGDQAGETPELKVAVVELEPQRVSMASAKHLFVWFLQDSKNKAASHFGIRV